jgi:hypothetical protein
MIEQLAARFGPKMPAAPTVPVVEPEPPPAPVVITSQAIVTYCRPWCLACGGWQAIEREYSDGSHRINCRTCGVVLEDRPMLEWPKKKRNEEKSTVEGV